MRTLVIAAFIGVVVADGMILIIRIVDGFLTAPTGLVVTWLHALGTVVLLPSVIIGWAVSPYVTNGIFGAVVGAIVGFCIVAVRTMKPPEPQP